MDQTVYLVWGNRKLVHDTSDNSVSWFSMCCNSMITYGAGDNWVCDVCRKSILAASYTGFKSGSKSSAWLAKNYRSDPASVRFTDWIQEWTNETVTAEILGWVAE